jgi:hypothetical protein
VFELDLTVSAIERRYCTTFCFSRREEFSVPVMSMLTTYPITFQNYKTAVDFDEQGSTESTAVAFLTSKARPRPRLLRVLKVDLLLLLLIVMITLRPGADARVCGGVSGELQWNHTGPFSATIHNKAQTT